MRRHRAVMLVAAIMLTLLGPSSAATPAPNPPLDPDQRLDRLTQQAGVMHEPGPAPAPGGGTPTDAVLDHFEHHGRCPPQRQVSYGE